MARPSPSPHLQIHLGRPALLKHEQERAEALQSRIADRITAFLTMIVSLEAIFLSTFVLISQNRADAKRQVIADEQWSTVQEEDQQNQELLDLSRQILEVTKEVRAFAGRDDMRKPQPEMSTRRSIK
jgi:hypothetical protein